MAWMHCAPLTLFPKLAQQFGDQVSHGVSQARQGQDAVAFGGRSRARVLGAPPPGEARGA